MYTRNRAHVDGDAFCVIETGDFFDCLPGQSCIVFLALIQGGWGFFLFY